MKPEMTSMCSPPVKAFLVVHVTKTVHFENIFYDPHKGGTSLLFFSFKSGDVGPLITSMETVGSVYSSR